MKGVIGYASLVFAAVAILSYTLRPAARKKMPLYKFALAVSVFAVGGLLLIKGDSGGIIDFYDYSHPDKNGISVVSYKRMVNGGEDANGYRLFRTIDDTHIEFMFIKEKGGSLKETKAATYYKKTDTQILGSGIKGVFDEKIGLTKAERFRESDTDIVNKYKTSIDTTVTQISNYKHYKYKATTGEHLHDCIRSTYKNIRNGDEKTTYEIRCKKIGIAENGDVVNDRDIPLWVYDGIAYISDEQVLKDGIKNEFVAFPFGKAL